MQFMVLSVLTLEGSMIHRWYVIDCQSNHFSNGSWYADWMNLQVVFLHQTRNTQKLVQRKCRGAWRARRRWRSRWGMIKLLDDLCCLDFCDDHHISLPRWQRNIAQQCATGDDEEHVDDKEHVGDEDHVDDVDAGAGDIHLPAGGLLGSKVLGNQLQSRVQVPFSPHLGNKPPIV